MKIQNCHSPLKFAVQHDEFNEILCSITRSVKNASKEGLNAKLNINPNLVSRANKLFRAEIHPQAESNFYEMVNKMSESIADYTISKFDVMVQGYCRNHQGIHTRWDTVHEEDLGPLIDPTMDFWAQYTVPCGQCEDAGEGYSALEKRIMTFRVDLPKKYKNNEHHLTAIQGGIKFIAFKLADKMLFEPDYEIKGQYELDRFARLAGFDPRLEEDISKTFETFTESMFDFVRYTAITANGRNKQEDIRRCKALLKRIRRMGQFSSIIHKDKLTGVNEHTYRDLKDIILNKQTGELAEGKIMTLKMADLAERNDSFKSGVYKKLQIDARTHYMPLYRKVARITLAITDLQGRTADTVLKYQAPGRLHHYNE